MDSKGTPYSIRIFLPGGDPDGLRIIGKSNWTGVGVVFARSGYKEALSRPEFKRTGVYVLVGTSEDSTLPSIYVGEGDPVLPRIQSHYVNKDFWEWCVFFVTNDESLNKAHVQYLESKLVQLATEAKKVRLDNQNIPKPPSLSESDEADMQSFLTDMLRVFPLVGLPVFEKPKRVSEDESPMLFIKAKGIQARGQETPEGFLVFQDSQIVGEAVPSMPSSLIRLRKDLEASGVILPLESGVSRFLQDYIFASPSTAAAVIIGRNTNGRTKWKDAKGKRLREIQAERTQK
jgi:hypothetical protein